MSISLGKTSAIATLLVLAVMQAWFVRKEALRIRDGLACSGPGVSGDVESIPMPDAATATTRGTADPVSVPTPGLVDVASVEPAPLPDTTAEVEELLRRAFACEDVAQREALLKNVSALPADKFADTLARQIGGRMADDVKKAARKALQIHISDRADKYPQARPAAAAC